MIIQPRDMPRTFVDPARDDELRVNGFTTFPVLDATEVAELRAAHDDLVGVDGEGMAVDYMRGDRRVMEEVNRLLGAVWDRHFSSIFVDHRPVFATFVIKHPGPGSAMFLHEDRSYVDERQGRAGTLWIPLVDTGPHIDNGCLNVVPGSHRLAVAFSGSNTPDLIRPYERHLEHALVPVEVPAGRGLFYDTRTLHASPPNRTDEPRPAIACAVAPSDAELLHVVGTGPRRRRVHAVDQEFFVRHGPDEIERAMPARYPVVEEFDDPVVELDPAAVAEVCGLAEAPPPETVVPEDLWPRFEQAEEGVPPEAPRRVGSLKPSGLPLRSRRGSAPAGGSDGRGEWVPASLWPGTGLEWWVGDPLLALVPGEPGSVRVRLRPRERLCLAAEGAGRVAVATVDAPPFGAGAVARRQAAVCEPGRVAEVEGGGPVVLWDQGPGELEAVVRGLSPSPRRARRRAERMADEVAAALG